MMDKRHEEQEAQQRERLSALLDELNAGAAPAGGEEELDSLLEVAGLLQRAGAAEAPPQLLEETLAKVMAQVPAPAPRRRRRPWLYSSALGTAASVLLVLHLTAQPEWPRQLPPPELAPPVVSETAPAPALAQRPAVVPAVPAAPADTAAAVKPASGAALDPAAAAPPPAPSPRASAAAEPAPPPPAAAPRSQAAEASRPQSVAPSESAETSQAKRAAAPFRPQLLAEKGFYRAGGETISPDRCPEQNLPARVGTGRSEGGGSMQYRYQETVDWGIIKREWIGETPDHVVVLEQHEEGRFTVQITHKRSKLEYYSYWAASGRLTFASLEAAQAFAADLLTRWEAGDVSFCSPR